MRNSKKLLSLFLALAMVFSMASGFVSKAADTITVTLRIEQDQATLAKPIRLKMTADDVKPYGSLGLASDTLNPLHVLVKYLMTEKGASEDTLEDYLLLDSGYLYGISLNGTVEDDYGSPSTDPDVHDAYWMFAVNDSSPVNSSTGFGYGMNEYPVREDDEIVFYGSWGGDYINSVSPFYSAFEQKEYQTEEKTPLDVTLLGFDIYNDYGVKASRPMSGAHIIVSDAEGRQMEQEFVTDENGQARLTFESAGAYTLSAYRKTADGAHYDISRPYAAVTVTEQKPSSSPSVSPTATPTAVPSATPTAVPSATPTTVPSAVPSVSPTAVPTVRPSQETPQKVTPSNAPSPDLSAAKKAAAPGKVKKVSVKVKKTKKKKRKVVLSWKKAAKAAGYEIWISKKKNKGYKLAAKVTKAKAVLKRKKGSYYIRIRAYADPKPPLTAVTTGPFSKPKKVKVK